MADVQETTEDTPESPVETVETTESTVTTTPAAQAVASEEKKLKLEAQKLRTRLRETEERENGLKTQLQTLSDRTQRADVHDALTAQSGTLGIKEFEVVKELVLANRGTLTFKDDGKIDGLDASITMLRAKYPTLFFDSPGKADGAAQGDAKTGFRISEWMKNQ